MAVVHTFGDITVRVDSTFCKIWHGSVTLSDENVVFVNLSADRLKDVSGEIIPNSYIVSNSTQERILLMILHRKGSNIPPNILQALGIQQSIYMNEQTLKRWMLAKYVKKPIAYDPIPSATESYLLFNPSECTNKQIEDTLQLIYSILSSSSKDKDLIISCLIICASIGFKDYFHKVYKELSFKIILLEYDPWMKMFSKDININHALNLKGNLWYAILAFFTLPAKGGDGTFLNKSLESRMLVAQISGFSASNIQIDVPTCRDLSMLLSTRRELVALNTKFILNPDENAIREKFRDQCRLVLSFGQLTSLKMAHEFAAGDTSSVWLYEDVAAEFEKVEAAWSALVSTGSNHPYARMLGMDKIEWNQSNYQNILYCALTKEKSRGAGATNPMHNYQTKVRPSLDADILSAALKKPLVSVGLGASQGAVVKNVLKKKGLVPPPTL